ncbi:MAG TPA: fumarylacetoacetate hydrolase family protein [Candidatus Polarisedimenticolaceae bacterium]|nr:fumarylacetoacetate hydrolase family protein [Candidatus Polarisedimenticolaceae bacterium]
MGVPPFNAYLGTEIVRRGKGQAEATLELQPHHLNRRGVAHGGVVTALLDSALGAAVISDIPQEWWCATTSLTAHFIGGARGGRLVATGRVLRRGRSVAFASGEIHDERGTLVAAGSGTWHLWPFRPGSAGTPPPRRRGVVMRGSGEFVEVGKILAVGRNYAEHVREMGAPVAELPVIFFKPPTALTGEGELRLPAGAGEIHHEVELVVVVGLAGRAISAERALDHVAGYAVGLDLTARELQRVAKRRGEPWSLAKGFDGSAPVSAVAPRDEIGDGSGLDIELSVNGERRQHGNTSQMLHPVPRLVAICSRWVTLEPGDLIFTGTPAGVGPLVRGDLVEARIAGVGRLDLRIA